VYNLADDLIDRPELAKALQDFVKARLTPYKCPRRIAFVPELPKSAAGEALRYKLRETDGERRTG